MKTAVLFGVVISILLSSCGSSPKTNFYTLNMIPARSGRHPAGRRVQLAAVHVPPALDRRQMVRMSGDLPVGLDMKESSTT